MTTSSNTDTVGNVPLQASQEVDSHPAVNRYTDGEYIIRVSDDGWKGEQMAQVIDKVGDRSEVKTYADVGTGTGGVFRAIVKELTAKGFELTKSIGFDVAPFPKDTDMGEGTAVSLRHEDFNKTDESFDLVTLNDVIEHLASPGKFLEGVADRSRYVALHIPLDDRLSVLLTNQYNFRLGPVGHINFWSPASALTLLTSAGLVPISCQFTPGFLAPTGRETMGQKCVIPVRWLLWKISPGLAASTVGGVSLAVLCRGKVA